MLKPGPDLDTLVSERLFHWTWENYFDATAGLADSYPKYSAYIHMAWDIVEMAWDCQVWKRGNNWKAYWQEKETGKKGRHGTAYGEHAAHAICLAALIAMGIIDSDGNIL